MCIQQSDIILGDQQSNKINYEALVLLNFFAYKLYQLHQLVKDISNMNAEAGGKKKPLHKCILSHPGWRRG